MLITRETDYALRIISALSTGEQLTASKICSQEFVPQQFGYKILKKLEKGNLVKIMCGSEGGCQICCDLKQVTLYDLIQIMERDEFVSSCMQQGFQCERRNQNGEHCTIHQNLISLQNRFNRELQSHSLHKIINM